MALPKVFSGIVVQDGQLNIDFTAYIEMPEINGIEIFAAGTTGNQSPVADAGPDQTATAGGTVDFDGSGSSDPDGEIVSYSWDFGDGATDSVIFTVNKDETGTYSVEVEELTSEFIVKAHPFPWALFGGILGGVLAALAATIAVYLVVFRRRRAAA